MRIDLNADLGEGVGDDDALLGIVTSANVATGAHAGGGDLLARTVQRAVARGVAVGAHPSYRDRDGFGRRSLLSSVRTDRGAREAFVADLVGQVLDVGGQAERHGVPLTHVKAHGALYNEAVADEVAAGMVVDAVRGVVRTLGYPVAVVSQPGGVLARTAATAGLPVVAEGFVDRGYLPSGGLVPRGQPGDLHHHVADMVAQAVALARGRVRTADGASVDVRVDSLCVHSDTPGAVRAAGQVRGALEGSGWALRAARSPAGPDYARVADRVASRLGPKVARPRALPFGDRALHVDVAGMVEPGTHWVLDAAAAAGHALRGARVVPGLASVLIELPGPVQGVEQACRRVEAAILARMWRRHSGEPLADAGRKPDTHEVAVRYDGPDLGAVAEGMGRPVDEVIRRHAAAEWTVASVGFSPGFGYLTCADPMFHEVPRRADPRRRVPPGAVAVAAGMSAIYPSASPGGWQLIGTSEHRLFDPASDRPATFAAGDHVRFRVLP